MNEADFFRVIADPTRRAILERLVGGSRNATEIRDGLSVSQPAVSQHLAVLSGAGLVQERKSGRQVLYNINPDGLSPLFDWLDRYRPFWPARVAKLQKLVREMDQ